MTEELRRLLLEAKKLKDEILLHKQTLKLLERLSEEVEEKIEQIQEEP